MFHITDNKDLTAKAFHDMVADWYLPDGDYPFNGEIEDDGFITVYVSPPLKQD